MDTDKSPTNVSDCQHKEDIACIKKCLVDLAADMCEVKNQVKKQTEIADKTAKHDDKLVQQWNTREEFEKFSEEINNESAKFDGFVEILNKLYKFNSNTIKNDLSKYFRIVLNAVFGKNVVKEISWNKYGGNLSIKNSMVIDAIQRSGVLVDSLTTEYGRFKLLQKEFSKFKDAKRIRTKRSSSMMSSKL